jgi:hypothetical protein
VNQWYNCVVTTEQLRNLWKTEPFRPFVIHLADGRQLQVRHPEFLLLSPSGRSIILYQPDDSFNVVDLLLVTDLEVTSNGRGKRRSRRR